MRRIFLPLLLAFGTVAGFAHGFHSLHHACDWHQRFQRESMNAYAPPPPPPALAPVQVQTAAPAASPQVLVIPIIVGQGVAPATAPTAYVLPSGAVALPAAVAPPVK